MAFAQLTYCESLRDIECCLRAMRGKLYHMGIRGKVSRSTIAYANENRDWPVQKVHLSLCSRIRLATRLTTTTKSIDNLIPP